VVDYEAYGNRGNVYFSLDKGELAINDYKKALSFKPDYHPSLDNLGAQYAKMGQFDSAYKYSTLAIKVKPEYKPAYSNRALTLMELKRFEEAIKDWEKFMEFEPDAFDVYNIIGSCYQQMGKYQESVASITKAIDQAPSNAKDPAFYLNRAISLNALKRTDEARQDALKAKQGDVALPADLAKSLGME
jgi:protein O-mannosyl-transferase